MKKNKIIIISVIVAVLLTGVFFYFNKKGVEKINNQLNQQTLQNQISPKSLTREDAPTNITVPNVGEKTQANVAAPVSVLESFPGASNNGPQLKIFNIQAKNNSYNPSTIIVNKNDTVHINFTAVDKTYDLTFPDYGMKQIVNPGQTKNLEFQALNDGKFTYYCSLCGGLNSGVKGYIIIK